MAAACRPRPWGPRDRAMRMDVANAITIETIFVPNVSETFCAKSELRRRCHRTSSNGITASVLTASDRRRARSATQIREMAVEGAQSRGPLSSPWLIARSVGHPSSRFGMQFHHGPLRIPFRSSAAGFTVCKRGQRRTNQKLGPRRRATTAESGPRCARHLSNRGGLRERAYERGWWCV